MSRSSGWATLAMLLLASACVQSTSAPKALGEPCSPTVAPGETASECADGLCIALDSASGFCTRSCTEDSKCGSGYVCSAAGRYGKVCHKLTGCKTDGECPAGHACNPGTGNCYIKVSRTLCSPCQDGLQCPPDGACFSAAGSGEQFCTTACGENGLCPQGFTCQSIPAGVDRAMISQCVPVSESCDFGKTLCAPCKGDAECGGAFDLCVRNVVSNETFCGKDCDPKQNVCPGAGCDPQTLLSAKNPGCPEGFSCSNIGSSDDPNVKGPFQCVPDSNTCAGYCSAADERGQTRQCGLGKACDGPSHHCQSASDGRQCAPCLDNDDCKKGPHSENRCLVNDCPDCPFKGESFCASPCLDDVACRSRFGPGFLCKAVSESAGSGHFCIPQRGSCASGLGQLGDDCSVHGAEDCVAGLCLRAGRSALCSFPCTEDSECGDTRYRCCEYTDAGHDCSESKRTANGPLSGTGLCAPLGGLFGDDCTPGRPPCQSGTCLDMGTARLCTRTCENGCPAGFACRKAVAGEGAAELEVCFPEGGGGAGADCSFGPAACASGLCIRKDSGPICSDACTEDSQCPESWHCSIVRAVNEQSVQACLPPALQ